MKKRGTQENADSSIFYPNNENSDPKSLTHHDANHSVASEVPDDQALFYREGAGKENGPYGAALHEGLNKIADQLSLSKTQLDSVREEARKKYFELGMSAGEAETIQTLWGKYQAEPPNVETVRAWEMEMRQRLRERYGLEGAHERVRAVRSYLKGKPSMRKMLSHTGLASHPEVVDKLVEKVFALQRAGKIKA